LKYGIKTNQQSSIENSMGEERSFGGSGLASSQIEITNEKREGRGLANRVKLR
jgi:hypothetical protein